MPRCSLLFIDSMDKGNLEKQVLIMLKKEEKEVEKTAKKSEVVYWADLQTGLSGTGLNIVVEPFPQDGLWYGNIDEKMFLIIIPPKSEKDGLRPFMIITLCGQKEEDVVPKLTQFMGYPPFCKYQNKLLSAPATVNLEWDQKDPAKRFGELSKDENIFELQKIEKGFMVDTTLDMKQFYQEFTPDIIKAWEEAVKKDDEAEHNGMKIKLLLPFIKKTMPYVGRTQSLFGLSLICLNCRHEKEKEIIAYGIQPLLKVGVITIEEAERIISWYLATESTWDSGGTSGQFKKEFSIDGVKYRIWTDSYRNCRDLNLSVVEK